MAVALFDNQEKEKFCEKRSQDDCLTSSCAPIQNPKMIAALKMKSLWFWFFYPFYSANLEKWTEIGDANGTIKLVQKIGIEHIGEIFKCFKMFTPHVVL